MNVRITRTTDYNSETGEVLNEETTRVEEVLPPEKAVGDLWTGLRQLDLDDQTDLDAYEAVTFRTGEVTEKVSNYCIAHDGWRQYRGVDDTEPQDWCGESNEGCVFVPQYTFAVTVTTDTAEHAAQVMRERIGPDEDYGFEYRIAHAVLPIEVDGEPYE